MSNLENLEHLDHHKYLDYQYDADVISIYDGDTITCNVDLGFNIKMVQKIRFFGIDTFELRGSEREKGLKAKDFVEQRIKNKKIKIYSIKDKTGKYGRYLGLIFYLKDDDIEKQNWINLNKELVENNHAKIYNP